MSSYARALSRLVERSPTSGVAAVDQRGWFFLATIKIGVMICVPLFALGGELGIHMRLADLVPAVWAGSIGTAILATLTGLVGMRARMPTAMLVRATFGEVGGKLIAALLILTLFGWFGVQTEVLVSSLEALLQATAGFTVDRLLLTIACGALISSTAIIGFRALGKVAYVAVPLLMAVIAVPTWVALRTHAWQPLLEAPAMHGAYSAGTVVSIIIGGHVVAIAITPDISRFMRSSRATVAGVAASYGFVLPILLTLAALLAAIYRNGDLVSIMILTGVGGPALLVIVLATWTANDKNLYETSLSLALLAPRVARWKLTVVAAVIGTSLAAMHIFGHFIAMLIFMGIVIGPVAGVYLVDYALAPGRYTPTAACERLRPLPFAAWLIGIAGGFLALPVESGGAGWLSLTSAPTLDAMLIAAIAQFVLQKGVERARPAPTRASSSEPRN